MSAEDSESRLEAYGMWPKDPAAIVAVALARLLSDGSVVFFDDETLEPYVVEASSPVSMQGMCARDYEYHCFSLALWIYGAACDIRDPLLNSDHAVRLLALALSPYRDEPELIAEATGMVRLDEESGTGAPQRPWRR